MHYVKHTIFGTHVTYTYTPTFCIRPDSKTGQQKSWDGTLMRTRWPNAENHQLVESHQIRPILKTPIWVDVLYINPTPIQIQFSSLKMFQEPETRPHSIVVALVYGRSEDGKHHCSGYDAFAWLRTGNLAIAALW